MPFTCYTTYADNPVTTTLAHQLTAAGENGAVAVYGAATLSDFEDNWQAASHLVDGLLSNKPIGESIRESKRKLGKSR